MEERRWTPERAKRVSENKVLQALAQKSPLRWTELLQETKLSSRTLKKALNRLESDRLINRKVGAGKEYPPPVYYGLNSRGWEHSLPQRFAFSLAFDIFRPPKDYYLGEPSEKELLETLGELGRKIGAIYLFTILRSLEDEKEWKIDSSIEWLFNLFIAWRIVTPKEIQKLKAEKTKKREIPPLESEDVQMLKVLLKKAYPDIIGKIENWFLLQKLLETEQKLREANQ